ncbi:MAG: hypothetical protein RR115_00515 [Hydrogenoanaerobacterium sp.]
MPDYKKMYAVLFNKITDTIEELQKIQCETEKMYIEDANKEEVFLCENKDCDKKEK